MIKQLLPNLTFVDVETTGTSPISDRIIDIGIVRVENGKIVEEFESLINPQTYLSPYITQITSITPEVLYKAPYFEEVKGKIYNLLADSVFVAHNVHFDYSFVKNEFARYETKFSSKMLCTVRLSRLLFPHERHHNLDAIINRFGISVETRHRALPDAMAMYHFWEKVKNEIPEEKFSESIQKLSKNSRIPSQINKELISNIPNLPGVYVFYDKEGTCLYVGKSTHLKDRITSHFSSFHKNTTDMKLSDLIFDIEIKRCGGDLSASLLESELIKKMQPLFNRQLRSVREVVAVTKNDNTEFHTVEVKRIQVPIIGNYENIIAVFPSIKKAKEKLYEICESRHICRIMIGLEKGKGKCFGSQIGKCDGACMGKESALKHNIKLIEAFNGYFIPKWPFEGEIIIEEKSEDLTEYIHINNWVHTGLSTFKDSEPTFTPKENVLYIDTVKILKKFLKKREYLNKVKRLPALA
jgi:DNA polymerase-3 subunit epsilon